MEKINNHNKEEENNLDFELKEIENNILKKMSPYEYNFIRKRIGKSFREIGKAAGYLGLRQRPYSKSTVYGWTENYDYRRDGMPIKAIDMLKYYIEDEQFLELRKEWIIERNKRNQNRGNNYW